MKFIFISNSLFGQIILEKLLESGITPSLLITAADKKTGRGQKIQKLFIKDFAENKKIKVEEAEDKEIIHSIIKKEKPHLVITAGVKTIISKETLSLSNFINIHPSLLPKYRGPTPIQSTILSGEKESGVTIIKMNEKIDEGPILLQEKISLASNIYYNDAEKILAEKGASMIINSFQDILDDKIIFIPQKEEDATYTKKIKKEDGKINWNDSAQKIERQIRALNPWPGTYSKMGEKTFKVLEAIVQEQTENGPFGDCGKMYLGTNNTIAIQTGKDFLLIKKLQIEGKNSTSAKDFLQ